MEIPVQLIKDYKLPLALGGVSLGSIIASILMIIKTSLNTEPIKINQSNDTIGLKEYILVDIAGGVNTPGVYELPAGSRIKDVLEKAGGLSENANQEYVAKYVNQAQEVEDGVKIFIPLNDRSITSHNVDSATRDSVPQNLTPLLRPASKSQNGVLEQNNMTLNSNIAGVSSLININSASQKELESLSGVGPVTASKIMANLPYGSLEELVGRKVVGQKLFDKIKPYIGF